MTYALILLRYSIIITHMYVNLTNSRISAAPLLRFLGRRRHQNRPDVVPGRPAGGAGAWCRGGFAGDLHGAGDQLLPPSPAARGQDGGRQTRGQGELPGGRACHSTYLVIRDFL